jgi:RNA polymerase sigma-70 factor (ECF subfamily)
MDAPTSTFGLVERARSGDRDALAALFEKYRRRLALLIHYKLGRNARERDDVEDVLQETLLRAFRDVERFAYRAPGSFFRWISAIADHVIVDRVRYRERACRAAGIVPFRSESNPQGPEPADSRTPSRIFSEHEGMARLLARIEALPESYREAIVMAKIEGLSTAEMAGRLGKTREAVALLVFRAVKKLRETTQDGKP